MAETDLISVLVKQARRHKDGQTQLGPGDDGAFIRSVSNGLVVSTDSYLEGSHYRKAWLEPEQLAQRCLGAALSDLAAMGALPRFYTLALSLDGSEPDDFIHRLGTGLGVVAKQFKIDLIGGDITKSRQQGLTFTVMGSPMQGRVLRRHGAREGDEIWLSGSLGASAAGLAVLKNNANDKSQLSDGFRTVEPRILLGTTLTRMGIASAGLDLSDGLILDLYRLCRASQCGAVIDRKSLPVDPRVNRISEMMNEPSDQYVLYGGEDYELLFCVSPSMVEAMHDVSIATSVRLTRIGVITSGKQVTDRSGTVYPQRGWDPFMEL
jgi:thiamine-monophosphate kinase